MKRTIQGSEINLLHVSNTLHILHVVPRRMQVHLPMCDLTLTQDSGSQSISGNKTVWKPFKVKWYTHFTDKETEEQLTTVTYLGFHN